MGRRGQPRRWLTSRCCARSAVSSGALAGTTLSARSLQRRLAEQRTSFSDLLAAVRRELAERYVLDHGLPVTEISYMLGFSDLSSFSRAFKRWTGRSPAEARRTRPRD